jgi:hypothetical protein
MQLPVGSLARRVANSFVPVHVRILGKTSSIASRPGRATLVRPDRKEEDAIENEASELGDCMAVSVPGSGRTVAAPWQRRTAASTHAMPPREVDDDLHALGSDGMAANLPLLP